MSAPPTQPLRDSFRPTKQGARRHYGSHPYFTKRAWNVVQKYIEHFSAPGDLVLDPFGGSGVTAVEALVKRRKALYADISNWARFLARQTAIAPVNLTRLQESFERLERECRARLTKIWATPAEELKERRVEDWYPADYPLPENSDVPLVEDLFTPRMLHGLALLRAHIMELDDRQTRDLLLFAFSATLVRINRTFLSTTNRRESRGGPAIFSLYRYKVAKAPVELNLWDQFVVRVARLIDAKKETNSEIGEFYKEGQTAVFQHGSATRLSEWIEPESVDYIYTDPPYGGHISYLDLSTMWAAWLDLPVEVKDRAEEIIEGGQLHKPKEEYHRLMRTAFEQMASVLKQGRWLSLVFAHRDTEYWEQLVDAAKDVGLGYVNTVVQPVGVVWSMHKKKNPLRVLSGELVLNFRKTPGPLRRKKRGSQRPADQIVKECCERTIVHKIGATTEDLHHAVIPALLESGALADFSATHGDLTPLLQDLFDFDGEVGKWFLRDDRLLGVRVDSAQLLRYHIARFLLACTKSGSSPTIETVFEHVAHRLDRPGRVDRKVVRKALGEVGYSPDDRHWRLLKRGNQKEFAFAD